MAREPVGTVVNASAKGLLVKASRMIPIGTGLVDVRNSPVGRVHDVLGPVASPYLVIGMRKGASIQRILDREVYLP